ncbi:hypothetical protein MRB53_026283 [Persea americana]|uniref:Uncharacterized protein n=1 Tax=Persea americana TaxID=3435 RepID=A0ACC2LHS4_PERAE|nr:hypothetical protein MRB53_026283 [Persea americana]
MDKKIEPTPKRKYLRLILDYKPSPLELLVFALYNEYHQAPKLLSPGHPALEKFSPIVQKHYQQIRGPHVHNLVLPKYNLQVTNHNWLLLVSSVEINNAFPVFNRPRILPNKWRDVQLTNMIPALIFASQLQKVLALHPPETWLQYFQPPLSRTHHANP